MNLFELFVKIGVDDQASNKIEKLSSWTVAKGQLMADAMKASFKAITEGIYQLTKSAVDNYAEYEQLVGGVETLFGAGGKGLEEYAASTKRTIAEASKDYYALLDTQRTVIDNASEAYRTAGLSANEYMSTVTSFAASLLQSTGRGAQTNLEQLEADLEAEIEATKAAHKKQQTELSNRIDLEIAEYKAAADAKIATIDKANKEEIAEAKAQKNVMIAQLKAHKKEELEELKASQKLQIAQMELALDDQLALAEAANMKSVQTAESQQRATELANMAVIDMADNANKMGSSIESIQLAYGGFAKANFTMLDNLNTMGASAA